jgi:hypothetical protein
MGGDSPLRTATRQGMGGLYFVSLSAEISSLQILGVLAKRSPALTLSIDADATLRLRCASRPIIVERLEDCEGGWALLNREPRDCSRGSSPLVWGDTASVRSGVPLRRVRGRRVAASFRMLPAVAVRRFMSCDAWIIDANDEAPPSHGIRTTVNMRARNSLGAGRLATPNHVGGREHDLQVVCPL